MKLFDFLARTASNEEAFTKISKVKYLFFKFLKSTSTVHRALIFQKRIEKGR